jgi:pimeloyl-ACP methyl ester carboxylesterase
MAKTIVMIHGANEGGWVFDQFKAVFEELDWTCHAPDLVGHGLDADKKGTALIGIGMADYLSELEAFLETVGPQPVLLGHSMGAVLAQQLAAPGDWPARSFWSVLRRMPAFCPRPTARSSWRRI